ncbi:hypothetical protein TrVE_jg1330 [Triparma verrucosa]|uniref:Uncharacterized protein n=1 Tax=Triparma verrucosa TaxID=1606542 RepID=A0A9W7KRV0_9STRA|nr:hypothetical protein TrVE_jg1330 [Triparma verrucosa]
MTEEQLEDLRLDKNRRAAKKTKEKNERMLNLVLSRYPNGGNIRGHSPEEASLILTTGPFFKCMETMIRAGVPFKVCISSRDDNEAEWEFTDGQIDNNKDSYFDESVDCGIVSFSLFVGGLVAAKQVEKGDTDEEKELKRIGTPPQVVRGVEREVGTFWIKETKRCINTKKSLGAGSYPAVLGEARVAVSLQVRGAKNKVFNLDASEEEEESELKKFCEYVESFV